MKKLQRLVILSLLIELAIGHGEIFEVRFKNEALWNSLNLFIYPLPYCKRLLVNPHKIGTIEEVVGDPNLVADTTHVYQNDLAV